MTIKGGLADPEAYAREKGGIIADKTIEATGEASEKILELQELTVEQAALVENAIRAQIEHGGMQKDALDLWRTNQEEFMKKYGESHESLTQAINNIANSTTVNNIQESFGRGWDAGQRWMDDATAPVMQGNLP